MTETTYNCEHTCKGQCQALDVALQREKEAILLYGQFRDECEYPDVKAMLNNLILRQQKTLHMIEDTMQTLHSRFEVLDQIQESFET